VPRSDRFPRIEARDLEGRDVVLPDAFDGDRNVVIVAFRREHQGLVDSWIPWLEERAAHDPGLRFYELPTIARLWAPMRGFIDGGMATAIKDPTVLRRTLTVYGDRTRLTDPLGIGDRGTVTILLVDADGTVRWTGSGGFVQATVDGLDAALRSA